MATSTQRQRLHGKPARYWGPHLLFTIQPRNAWYASKFSLEEHTLPPFQCKSFEHETGGNALERGCKDDVQLENSMKTISTELLPTGTPNSRIVVRMDWQPPNQWSKMVLRRLDRNNTSWTRRSEGTSDVINATLEYGGHENAAAAV